MGFEKFCPKCGKETNIFVGKVCKDCFLKGKSLFELEKVSISVCKHCNRLFVANSEVHYNEELIIKELTSKVKVIPELIQPKISVDSIQNNGLNFSALIKVQGLLAEQVVDQEKVFRFSLKETTCDACMKLNADYREAIIQLRADNDRDREAMFQLASNLLEKEKTKDALSDTSKIISSRNGVDLWIGSKKAAVKVSRELAHIYNTKIITSKKLIGEEKSGERKYRHTFCIKIS